MVGTYSVSIVPGQICPLTQFTVDQTVIALQGSRTIIAPPAVISALPTVIMHVFPTIPPAELPSLGSLFEFVTPLSS